MCCVCLQKLIILIKVNLFLVTLSYLNKPVLLTEHGKILRTKQYLRLITCFFANLRRNAHQKGCSRILDSYCVIFCITDYISCHYTFSIKSEFFCYTAGVVENGQVSWRTRKEDQCHNTSFQTERWIPLKISVRNGTQVSFYGNNGKITEWKLSGASYGAKGGMIIRNSNKESDQTRIYFKDLKIKIVHQ